MGYIILILIGLFFLGAIVSFIKDVLSAVWDFIVEHIGPILAVIALIALSVWAGVDVAITLVVGCFVVWGAWRLVRALYVAIRSALQESHRDQLQEWLAANARQLGQVSAQDMLARGRSVSVPDRFIHYSYPAADSCRSIVDSFIEDCENELGDEVSEALYAMVRKAGMIEEQEVKAHLAQQYNKRTRYHSVQDICSAAVKQLESVHRLDRPTADKKVLHCVGVTGGTNFESEELKIEV